jgi:hypothetical protein
MGSRGEPWDAPQVSNVRNGGSKPEIKVGKPKNLRRASPWEQHHTSRKRCKQGARAREGQLFLDGEDFDGVVAEGEMVDGEVAA